MALVNSNQVVSDSVKPQQERLPFTASHVRLMSELWVRMDALYPFLWTKDNGLSEMDNPKFVTWCRKLQYLSLDQFKRGFENIEEAKAVAAQNNKPCYTPDYASFIGYTRKSADCTASMQAIQARVLPLMITKQLTPEEREYGNSQSAALKGLFG